MALKAKSKMVDGVRVDINTGVPIKQSTPEQQRNLIALNKLNSGQPPAQKAKSLVPLWPLIAVCVQHVGSVFGGLLLRDGTVDSARLRLLKSIGVSRVAPGRPPGARWAAT